MSERKSEPVLVWLPWVLLLTGGLVMLAGGLSAAGYGPRPFDIGLSSRWPSCEGEDLCVRASPAGWWWSGLGALLAAGAVALLSWTLPAAPQTPSGRSLPAVVHALGIALVSVPTCVVLGAAVLFTALLASSLAPVALFTAVLVQALLLNELGRAIGPGWSSPRRTWLTALAASALGAGAAVLLVVTDPTRLGWSPVLADGLMAGVVVLLAVSVGAPRGLRRRGELIASSVALLGAVAGGTALAQHEPTPAYAARPAAEATPPALTVPSESPAPVSSVPSAPVPPPVVTDVACTPADLSFAVPGFDAAMGARAASVQATNTADQPCWVEGFPVVTLLQGGVPLQLGVTPGPDPSGSPPVVERIGLAPGDDAFCLLSWRTYAGWADDETPQAVTVALVAGQPPVDVPIVSPYGLPAPFDIADGGEWQIGAWRLPTP